MQVLEIDKENRRLSLGHKQLEENPWDVFETLFNVGSVHEGTIIEMLEKGAVVSLPYGVEGFATPKHLTNTVYFDDVHTCLFCNFCTGGTKSAGLFAARRLTV